MVLHFLRNYSACIHSFDKLSSNAYSNLGPLQAVEIQPWTREPHSCSLVIDILFEERENKQSSKKDDLRWWRVSSKIKQIIVMGQRHLFRLGSLEPGRSLRSREIWAETWMMKEPGEEIDGPAEQKVTACRSWSKFGVAEDRIANQCG